MKTLCSIALVIIASIIVTAQNEEPLLIPIETNNQFPPDQLDTDALIEGSGGGGENKIDTTTEMHQPAPELESVDSETDINLTTSSDSATELPCPNPCVCSTEGDTDNYVVDCSGYDLTEFPSPIDSRTTTLKLHNNKLTVIPKEISNLKNLKILNAENNSIMELASGSVSELPELVILKLANNRLIEYPMDLKNSISLTKLEELDLGGNDIRTVVTAENFSNFKNLRVLTLPSATSELVLDLCGSLKDTLESVCTESCNTKTFECPDAPEKIDENLLDATLPGTISLSNTNIEESDPMEETPIKSDKSEEVTSTEEPPFSTDATSIASEGMLEERSEPQEEQKENENDLLGATLPGIIALSNAILKDSNDVEAPTDSKSEDNIISTEEPSMPIIPVLTVSVPEKTDEVIVSPRNSIVENSKKLVEPAVSIETSSVANGNDVNDFSLREKVINEPQEVSPLNNIAQEPKDKHEDVKIGANTVDTKTGGVDKSIIGIIVAGMIVVVAGITIKKNWSSITKRFSSNPRPHERNGVHSNGTAPEEVPLQDKSPV